MNNVFLDTNVILDYLLARTPFDRDAKQLFEEAELGNIELFASALSFCNMAYIVRKIKPTADFSTIANDLSTLNIHHTYQSKCYRPSIVFGL